MGPTALQTFGLMCRVGTGPLWDHFGLMKTMRALVAYGPRAQLGLGPAIDHICKWTSMDPVCDPDRVIRWAREGYDITPSLETPKGNSSRRPAGPPPVPNARPVATKHLCALPCQMPIDIASIRQQVFD